MDSSRVPLRHTNPFLTLFAAWYAVCIMCAGMAHSRTSIALFPAQGAIKTDAHVWLESAFSEYLFHYLRETKNCQVWNPEFLFRVDSSAWRMDHDSLLLAHRERWLWNAAIGANFRIQNDTLFFRLKLARFTDNRLTKETFTAKGRLRDFTLIMKRLGERVTSTLAMGASSLSGAAVTADNAWKAYTMGLYHEMRRRYSAALTAYYTASGDNPRFSRPYLHLSQIYKRSGYFDSSGIYIKKAMSCPDAGDIVYSEYLSFLVRSHKLSAAESFMHSRQQALDASAEGLTAIARYHLYRGNFDRANIALTRALNLGPSVLETQALLARLSVRQQNYAYAYELLRNLISRRPDYIPYYLQLGNAYRREGDLMESLSILEQARDRAPGHSAVLNSLGHTYFELEWYDKALAAFSQAATHDDDQAHTLINLAVATLKSGDTTTADSLFRRIAQKDLASALTNRANLYMRDNKTAKAITLYRKALKKGESSWKILYNLALAYTRAAKPEKAREYFLKLHSMQPGNTEITMYCAQTALRLGRYDRAIEYYESILNKEPTNKQALLSLCDVLWKQKRYKTAVSRLEKYLEYAPQDPSILLKIARTYLHLEWYQVATIKYRDIVKTYPDHLNGYLGWANAILHNLRENNRGEWDMAIKLAQKARDMAPEENPHIHMILAKLYLYKQKNEKARSHLQTALSASQKDTPLKKEITALLKDAF